MFFKEGTQNMFTELHERASVFCHTATEAGEAFSLDKVELKLTELGDTESMEIHLERLFPFFQSQL